MIIKYLRRQITLFKENSVRINELNLIALDELKNYHLVMRENFLIPEKILYNLPITVRFLENEQDFAVLVSALKENGYKKGSLILAFNANTIIRIGAEGKKRYDTLRRMGFKTCVYGFGEEFNSLDIFAKMNFDYLRLEATYFDSTPAKKRILNMLIAYCRTNKINLVMEGVDTPPQMTRFKKAGIKLMTGKAVSKLVRFVTNDFLGLPELKGTKKDAYLKKLKIDLEAEEERSHQEYEKLRLEAIEKAKAEALAGGVMPVSARPELKKSPYQVRLELQKQAALHAAQAIIDKISAEQYYKATAEEQYGVIQPQNAEPQAELY
ncbi:MAG: EAL domain-containing protein, partial [Clostridia bacterium]|nr:EAL domain-containing protein [Clostridia bacterium]